MENIGKIEITIERKENESDKIKYSRSGISQIEAIGFLSYYLEAEKNKMTKDNEKANH